MSMLVWSSILVCIKVWVCVSLISPRVWDMRISGDLWPGVHSECEDSRTGQGLPANQSAPVQPVASNTLTLTLNCIHASLWVVQCESGTVQHRCSSRHHTHTHPPQLAGPGGRSSWWWSHHRVYHPCWVFCDQMTVLQVFIWISDKLPAAAAAGHNCVVAAAVC